ncbi:hypothetical protein ACHAXS_006508 [Conticribra weissflogii]
MTTLSEPSAAQSTTFTTPGPNIPRMEQVFYATHAKVSTYILRHTSRRLRSFVEHFVLALAVCAFCSVLLSHWTFVHRVDGGEFGEISLNVIFSASGKKIGAGIRTERDDFDSEFCGDVASSERHDGGGSISVFSIMVYLMQSGYSLATSNSLPSNNTTKLWSTSRKRIPGTCLKSIPGFTEDADVTHILMPRGDYREWNMSRAFTLRREKDNDGFDFALVSGMPTNSSLQPHACVIDVLTESNSLERHVPSSVQIKQQLTQQITYSFGFPLRLTQTEKCPTQISSLLSFYEHLQPTQQTFHQIKMSNIFDPNNTNSRDGQNMEAHSSKVYSYSHSPGLLQLPPELLFTHNISTQFIIPSPNDPNCFGEPFMQSIVFRLIGVETIMLNWILGFQGSISQTQRKRPRFVIHWNSGKEVDLDSFDMDHYAFSSSSQGSFEARFSSSSTQQYVPPLLRLFRFLTFKLAVLLSTLFIFFLTTSLVSFTFQETQDRMLDFTLQLQMRVRMRLPLGGLIFRHVLENLAFVPVMVGMIFFLIEFYGGDKFIAFMVLSMVWICEVFSAISIRSIQGMHFFPRVFFLYFTLFHVYFFSCPVGFTYTSLLSTILFLIHTMIFFCNRYELPALHSGLTTPQSPRVSRAIDERPLQNSQLQFMPRFSSPTNRPVRADLGVLLIQPDLNVDEHTSTTAPLTASIERSSQDPNTGSSTPYEAAPTFQPSLPPAHMNRFATATSSSLQSMHSTTSNLSSTSFAERTSSPNWLLHGAYGRSSSSNGVSLESEDDDSYLAYFEQELNPNHIYLDTCATFSQVIEDKYVANLQQAKTGLVAHCNAGKVSMDQFGYFGKLKVWYNALVLANILSFSQVEKHYDISYGTKTTSGNFIVHTQLGDIIFKKNGMGLPYLDLQEDKCGLCLITTIRNNFEGFTKKEINQAKEAHQALAKIGYPTEKEFTDMVRHKMIANCPINDTDIANAHKICGPDLSGIRGKSTRAKPQSVKTEYISIPRNLVMKNKFVCLAANVMFVDRVPFLVTVSRGIKFITIEHTPQQTVYQFKQSLTRVMQIYARAGFTVQTILVDGQYEPLKQQLLNIVVNTTASSEHVGEVERTLRVIKEQARATVSGLPYQRMPRRILIELINFVVFWLNAFPARTGVSPQEIIIRQAVDYNKHCKTQFGSYCEVFDDPQPSNTLSPQTQPAISIGPTGNLQ